MNNRVERAMRRHKEAAEQLIEVVKQVHPIGSIVTVSIGRSVFQAEIIDHSESWWCNPGTMKGRNMKTGKIREFCDYRIIAPGDGREEV
jgi:hypothetical protein